jgi:heme exporter protein D
VGYDKLGWLAVGMSLIALWLASRVKVKEANHPATLAGG